jgi:hypothetical protein
MTCVLQILLAQIQTKASPEYADALRALACRALLGLYRADAHIAQLVDRSHVRSLSHLSVWC